MVAPSLDSSTAEPCAVEQPGQLGARSRSASKKNGIIHLSSINCYTCGLRQRHSICNMWPLRLVALRCCSFASGRCSRSQRGVAGGAAACGAVDNGHGKVGIRVGR